MDKVIDEAITKIEYMLKLDEERLHDLAGKDDTYYLGKVNAFNEVLTFLQALKEYMRYF